MTRISLASTTEPVLWDAWLLPPASRHYCLGGLGVPHDGYLEWVAPRYVLPDEYLPDDARPASAAEAPAA